MEIFAAEKMLSGRKRGQPVRGGFGNHLCSKGSQALGEQVLGKVEIMPRAIESSQERPSVCME